MLSVLASALFLYKERTSTGLLIFIELYLSGFRVRPPLTATFFIPAEKNPYVDSCLKPLYNGHFLLCPMWPL